PPRLVVRTRADTAGCVESKLFQVALTASGQRVAGRSGRVARTTLFPGPAVRGAPAQAGVVGFLFALELVVGDEMNLPAEPRDDRAFLVAMTDPFLLVGNLACIETAVRAVNSVKVPYLRLPHHVGRRIECAELVRPPVLKPAESANGAV